MSGFAVSIYCCTLIKQESACYTAAQPRFTPKAGLMEGNSSASQSQRQQIQSTRRTRIMQTRRYLGHDVNECNAAVFRWRVGSFYVLLLLGSKSGYWPHSLTVRGVALRLCLLSDAAHQKARGHLPAVWIWEPRSCDGRARLVFVWPVVALSMFAARYF